MIPTTRKLSRLRDIRAMSASLLGRSRHAHCIANERQQWAIDLFTTSSGNDSYLRIPAVHPVSSHCRALSRSRPQSTSDGLSWGPAHGPKKVEDGRLGADEALGASDEGRATEARPRAASSR
jgi:hypothetical protein